VKEKYQTSSTNITSIFLVMVESVWLASMKKPFLMLPKPFMMLLPAQALLFDFFNLFFFGLV